jgi:hypothetical protein
MKEWNMSQENSKPEFEIEEVEDSRLDEVAGGVIAPGCSGCDGCSKCDGNNPQTL